MQFLLIFNQFDETNFKFFSTRYMSLKYAATLEKDINWKVVELKEIVRKGEVKMYLNEGDILSSHDL